MHWLRLIDGDDISMYLCSHSLAGPSLEYRCFFYIMQAGQVTTLWLSHPLSVSQHGQLSLPSLRDRLVSSNPCCSGLRRQTAEGVVRGVAYRPRQRVLLAARLECRLAAGSRPRNGDECCCLALWAVRESTRHWGLCLVLLVKIRVSGIKRCFCQTFIVYNGPKSRTERPRKTKIGTGVAHITRDSGTTFKVKRSKVMVTRPLYSPRQAAAAVSVGTYWSFENTATLRCARRR